MAFDFFKRIFGGGASTAKPARRETAASAPGCWSPRVGGYVQVSEQGALGVAAVYQCVSVLANSVASLPLRFLRRRDGIFVEETDSGLDYLLNVEPSPGVNAVDFWRMVVQHKLLAGNAYIVPVHDGARYVRLVLVDPLSVSHDPASGRYTVSDPSSGVSGTYDGDSIIHIRNYASGASRPGISTLAFARMSVRTAKVGDSETLDRFTNGGNVRGIVSNDRTVTGFGEYQDSELGKTATDIDGRFRSGERIVSLPGQVQFSPLSLSSTDMQFLESRKFTVRDICRFFGVHPSLVFDDSATNYKSAEMANVAFLSTTLNPILRQIEVELLRKLVAPSLARRYRFEFDREALYACDLASRANYQRETIAAGLYTINEWRRKENRPPVGGGDTTLVSANLKTIGELLSPGNGNGNGNGNDNDNDKKHDNDE